jgi:hypothetical protein
MLMHLVLDCNGALAVQLKDQPHFQIRLVRFYNGSSSQPLTSDHEYERAIMEYEVDSSTKADNEADSWFAKLGPGLITGAADDDPSGIATYSQASAQFGLNL